MAEIAKERQEEKKPECNGMKGEEDFPVLVYLVNTKVNLMIS